MAAVDESERKWRYALLLLVIELCIPLYAVVSARNTDILYVEQVSRRHSNDIYYFTNSSNSIIMHCGPDGSIYLISDKQCVTDQELLTRGNHNISNPFMIIMYMFCIFKDVPMLGFNLRIRLQ